MIRMRSIMIQCLIICFLLLLIGCSNSKPLSENAPAPGDMSSNPVLEDTSMEIASGNLTLWSYYEGAEWIIPFVQETYPDIEINVITLEFLELVPALLKAVDEGSSPDLVLLDQEMFQDLNTLQIFENLSHPLYGAEEFVEVYPADALTPFRGLENQHLFTLPLEISPAVTFYRHDLIEQAGFPADPKELANFMENSDRWLQMAETLKEDGIAMISNETDPLLIAEYSTGFFNEQFIFSRSNEIFSEMMEVSREVMKKQLDFSADISTDRGIQALKDNKVAMFHGPWWYYYELEEIFPELNEKWRVTRLPFGIYGSGGSSTVSISKQSTNKHAAWLVSKLLAEYGKDLFADSKMKAENPKMDSGDPYFNNQKVGALYYDLMKNIPPVTLTPLDSSAKAVWDQRIMHGIAEEGNPDVLIRDVGKTISDMVNIQLDLLRQASSQPDRK